MTADDLMTAEQAVTLKRLAQAAYELDAFKPNLTRTEADMRHDQVETIAEWLGVTEQDVIDMNRWLSGDASLNATIRDDGESGEWQDWLVDEGASQETAFAAREEFDNRRKTLASALSVLNDRERRIFEARRLAEDPITLADLAAEFGVSRERVRQINVSSFEKVQTAVKNRMPRSKHRLALASQAF